MSWLVVSYEVREMIQMNKKVVAELVYRTLRHNH
jgi:hypothetical protein